MKIGLLLATAGVGVLAPAPHDAENRGPGPGTNPTSIRTGLQSWIAEWDHVAALEALRQNAAAYSELSVFCYKFRPDGSIIPASQRLADITAQVRISAPQAKLLVTIVNDVENREKDARFIRALLADKRQLSRHLDEIAILAVGYDGIDIDYENFKKEPDRAVEKDFTSFITELKRRLGPGKILTVTLESSPRGVDWPALAKAADRLNIMAYYSHWRTTGPGPLSEQALLRQIVENLKKRRVPLEKVRVALPTYGFDWVRQADGRWDGKLLDQGDPLELARSLGAVRIHRDAEQNAWFKYNDPLGREHTVYFADALSLKTMADLLHSLGITQLGLWRLGRGPAVF